MKNVERELDVKLAIEKVRKTIKYFGIKYNIDIYKFEEFYVNTVKDCYGNFLAVGKGVFLQSLASALFETVEHYIYSNLQEFISTDIKMNINDLVSQNDKIKIQPPINILNQMNYKGELDCVMFTSLDSDKKVFYPKFLLGDHSSDEIREFEKYSSNNGFATGVSKTEALIHAINEVMERHHVSLHYINYFLKGQKNITKIRVDSLPFYLKRFHKRLEEKIGANINIYDVTEVEGFYTFLVWSNIKELPLPLKASGCSAIPSYALERALSEFFQIYSVYDSEDYDLDLNLKKSLKNSPKLYNIVSKKYFDAIMIEKDFKHSFQPPNTASVKDILKFLSTLLEKNGFDLYYKTIYQDENLVCVKVIILNSDNFQLIDNGKVILPLDCTDVR